MEAQDIIAEAATTRAALTALELDLAGRIDEIEAAAFAAGRPFTKGETLERDRLRAALGETRDALRELAFVTLQQLDRSATVMRLLADIKDVNAQLQGDLERLARIKRFADLALTALNSLTKVVGLLARFAVP